VFFKLAKKNKAKLEKLKYLNIMIDPEKHLLSVLNQFKELEHIEIETGCSDLPQTISLKNLKVLRIKDFIIYWPIKLDTPNLIELEYYGSLDQVLIKNPLSIIRLTTSKFDDNAIRFKNLEHLNIQIYRLSDSSLLRHLPKLKEVFFHIRDRDDFYDDEFKPKIKKLMKDRLKSGRSDMRVYCGDIHLVDGKQYNDFRLEDNDGYKYLLNWNNLSDRIPLSIEEIDYYRMMEAIEKHHNNQFPDDLFKRFFNLNCIELSSSYKLDTDRFISFLTNLHNVELLFFESSPYNQSFYDQLPIACPFVKQILLQPHVDKEDEESEKKDVDKKIERLNFNFALQFKSLERFGTNAEFSIEEIRSILSKNIEYLIFYFQNFAFYLTKNEDDNKYSVDCNYDFEDMYCKCGRELGTKYFCHHGENKLKNADFDQIMDYFTTFDPENNDPQG